MNDRFETFTVLVNRISRNIRRIKNTKMAEYGLRSIHVSCLYYLYTCEGLTASELCDRCEEDKATISRAVEYLESRGYLEGESREQKRYKSPLLLTEEGRIVGQKIAQKIGFILEEMGQSLSPEERESFYRSLAVISESLESIAGKD